MANDQLDGQKGIVLNDFRPSEIFISNDGSVETMTSYLNLSYSYVLYDLAISLAELTLLNDFDEFGLNFSKQLIRGYESVNQPVNLKHLYLLIMIYLMQRILENAFENDFKLKYVKIFETLYLKDSEIFL